jgi:hypothetical protein
MLEPHLTICRKVHGEEHLDTLEPTCDVASYHAEAGDIDKGGEMSESCLAIWKRALGEKHRTTLRVETA